jgi:hypothetical protein
VTVSRRRGGPHHERLAGVCHDGHDRLAASDVRVLTMRVRVSQAPRKDFTGGSPTSEWVLDLGPMGARAPEG